MDIPPERRRPDSEDRSGVCVQQVLIVTEYRLLGRVVEIGARHAPRVSHRMFHVPGGLQGPDALRAGCRELAARAETAEELRKRRTRGVDALRRDAIVRERSAVAVRIPIMWIVDRDAALGEVGSALRWSRHDDGRIAEGVVGEALGRQPEEGAVALDRAAERPAENVVGNAVQIFLTKCSLVERLLLEVGQLAPERVQLTRAELVKGTARPVVRAATVNRVEHPAAGASHLGIVGVRLHLHLLDCLEYRNDDRPIPHVCHRHAVHRVVVAAKRPATQRQQRGVGLVGLLHPYRVAGVDHVRSGHGHDEYVAARSGQHLELAPIYRRSERGAALLDQGSFRSNGNRLFDTTHAEGNVHDEGVRYADRQTLSHERSETKQFGAQRVIAWLDVGKGILADFVGNARASRAGVIARQDELRSDDHGTIGITHETPQSTMEHLGEDAWRGYASRQRQEEHGSMRLGGDERNTRIHRSLPCASCDLGDLDQQNRVYTGR